LPFEHGETAILISEAIARVGAFAHDGKIRAVRRKRTDDNTGKNDPTAEIGRAASSSRGNPEFAVVAT
jgi:hypothetical protein